MKLVIIICFVACCFASHVYCDPCSLNPCQHGAECYNCTHSEPYCNCLAAPYCCDCPMPWMGLNCTSSVVPSFNYNGYIYLVPPKKVIWQTAVFICKSVFNSDLVSILSAEEHNTIVTNIQTLNPTGCQYFVGFSNVGTNPPTDTSFTWTDGSPFTYTNWYKGSDDSQPDGPIPGCGAIACDWAGPFQWFDEMCESYDQHEYQFICKHKINDEKVLVATSPAASSTTSGLTTETSSKVEPEQVSTTTQLDDSDDGPSKDSAKAIIGACFVVIAIGALLVIGFLGGKWENGVVKSRSFNLSS